MWLDFLIRKNFMVLKLAQDFDHGNTFTGDLGCKRSSFTECFLYGTVANSWKKNLVGLIRLRTWNHPSAIFWLVVWSDLILHTSDKDKIVLRLCVMTWKYFRFRHFLNLCSSAWTCNTLLILRFITKSVVQLSGHNKISNLQSYL